MIEKKLLRNITIILLLTMPLFCVGFSSTAPEHSVWIVRADRNDGATDLAIQTLLSELDSTKQDIRETTLSGLESVPLQVDVLIVVGHGQPDGLEVSDNIIPWSELYGAISRRQPQKTIVLACDSPSDPDSNVFGFGERIDAEAGAIIASWLINQELNEQDDITFPFDRVSQAQYTMRNPLGRYLYFVHGYWGEVDDFHKMRDEFARQPDFFSVDYDPDNVKFFSYFDFYNAGEESEKDSVHHDYSISDFADNFYNELALIPHGSQVNIIAHSMGGLIVREMLRLHRGDLFTRGLYIGMIITLGTPHDGTILANPLNPWTPILSLLGGLLASGTFWPSPVFWSMDIFSPFINTLNEDPWSYSAGIKWYTISGFDSILSAVLMFMHGDDSDPIVAVGRTHLPFESNSSHFSVGHQILVVDDAGTTCSTVIQWITAGEDSDNDGLTDDSEVYYHMTNPFDSDSDNDGLGDYEEIVDYNTDPTDSDTDNDGLSDGAEILTYNTDPFDSNSDNDAIGDGNEVAWGYDPTDKNDPIPASSLIYISKHISGITGYVRANHYSAMDYVKVYVRYKTSSGHWTGYTYVGLDSTPYYSGDYYISWAIPQGYVQMNVKVKAYDSSNHYLGSDVAYVTLPSGGGGGGGPLPD